MKQIDKITEFITELESVIPKEDNSFLEFKKERKGGAYYCKITLQGSYMTDYFICYTSDGEYFKDEKFNSISLMKVIAHITFIYGEYKKEKEAGYMTLAAHLSR